MGMTTPRLSTVFLLGLLSAGLIPSAPRASFAAQAPDGPHPTVLESIDQRGSPPLRDIRPIPPRAGELRELPRKMLPNREGSSGSSGPDPLLQPAGEVPLMPATNTNFEGINNVDGVLPPDTNGDVGPNHYVQTVNLSFAIWSKSGTLLYGPADINTLWQGTGGVCATTNDGDPIALYDHLADRWLISQFALPSFPFGPFYQCIAISQTSDPLGSYHLYTFLISNTKMNDYPKFGVWPDGYYMAINQFNQASLNWAGQGVVAFERDKMLQGVTARAVRFDLFNTDQNLGGMLPADLDGPVPPPGAPNPFMLVDDDAWGYSPDQLQIWDFHVDWTNPKRSTFSRDRTLTTVAFDSNLCGYLRNCIPQPGGTSLDAISDRLMYRLQYRNFGTHQTLVVNHTVDANGADRAGVRWYEVRDSGAGWSINQQGTYSPDATHRWMGSTAMDSLGNLALGYSASSSSVHPSIRYVGRLAGDPAGTLPQGETTLIAGSGYQQHSSGRWGDYSMLAVDPLDDCTFWYTQEYYATIGSAPWQTRIGSFRFPSCGGVPGPTPTSTATPANTLAPTNTPLTTATNAPSPTATNTPLSMATNTPLPTASNTPRPKVTPTPINTPINTPIPTNTPTRIPTPILTPLSTPTPTPSDTGLLSPASNSPETSSAGDNNGFEVSPADAYGNDGLFAVDNNSGTGTKISCTDNGKDKHRFWTFGINLPSGTQVHGIQVRLDARADSTSGAPMMCVQLSWNGGLDWTSTKSTAGLTTSEAIYILGGSSDTWGRAWTVTDLSNTNFRVRVIDVASSTERDFSLDWVAVKVSFQP